MPAVRQTVVTPLGLITTPNQYGVFPAGALEQAQNCVMRQQGLLMQAPAFGTAQSVGATNEFIYRLMPLDGGHVYAWTTSSGTWSVFENGNAVTLPSSVAASQLFNTGGRINPVRARERMLVNSNQGVLVGDFMAPTNSTQRALRMAGMPQPQFASVFINATNPGGVAAIPQNVMVGYATVLTRTFSDGYVIKSVPSPIAKILNGTVASQNVQVTISWSLSAGVVAGDVVGVYRTDGIASATSASDPGTTLKLINSVTLSSTDAANGFVSFLDTRIVQSPFYTTSGRELYTNPFQEGSTGANRQPDINGAQAVFKGFTFFGNITERPQWTFNVPGGIGSTFASAQNTPSFRSTGIGRRLGAGTITNGSNTITGISATEIAGLKVGMFWDSGTPPFASTATITAVGASTVTMSVNATGGASSFAFADVIQIAGSSGTSNVKVGNVEQVFSGFATANSFGAGAAYELTANQSYLSDVLTIADTAPTLVVTVEPIRPNFASSITVRATNGANYSPPIPEFTATAQTFSQTTTPNLLRWSKDSEPEHTPSVNETQVGNGIIIKLVPTKDALWIFCTDGVYRLSGDAGLWRIDVVAPNCVLVAPNAACSMRDQVYAYTNYGFVAVTDAGVVPISDLLIKTTLPGPPYTERYDIFVEANDDDQEVIICTGFNSTTVQVYSALQNGFTTLNVPAGIFNSVAQQRYPASGNAAMLFGTLVSGSAPSYAPWNSSTSFLQMDVRYRPFFGDDPMVTKQWIDASFLLATTDSGKVLTSTFSTVTAGAATLVRTVADAIGTVGVPRDRAIDTSCRIGFSIPAAATQAQFKGVSLRYAPMTAQQVRR